MINPDEFYTSAQRAMQKDNESVDLANAAAAAIVRAELEEAHIGFIQSLDYFFLSSLSSKGEPTVSYKGGPVGFVQVVDNNTLMFPNYDGNGMFYSLGNIQGHEHIGLLFIDMETPLRLRVQGRARINQDQDKLAQYPGANMVILVDIDSVFYNCARYIHKFKRVEDSKYIPDAQGEQPYPAWKRIDMVQPALHPRDQGRAEQEGGVITNDDYERLVSEGNS